MESGERRACEKAAPGQFPALDATQARLAGVTSIATESSSGAGLAGAGLGGDLDGLLAHEVVPGALEHGHVGEAAGGGKPLGSRTAAGCGFCFGDWHIFLFTNITINISVFVIKVIKVCTFFILYLPFHPFYREI